MGQKAINVRKYRISEGKALIHDTIILSIPCRIELKKDEQQLDFLDLEDIMVDDDDDDVEEVKDKFEAVGIEEELLLLL